MKVGWLAGWGIEPDALLARVSAAFPELSHDVVLPGRIEPTWPLGYQAVVGWSWGAFRLLEWAIQYDDSQGIPGERTAIRLFFVSPFAAFASEADQGGRCSRSQVKWLRRWLKRDPEAALADFYQRAGLTSSSAETNWTCPQKTSPHLGFWERELEAMESASLVVPTGFLLENGRILKKGWVGQEDLLLEPTQIAQKLGIITVPGAGHDICEFFSFLTKDFTP